MPTIPPQIKNKQTSKQKQQQQQQKKAKTRIQKTPSLEQTHPVANKRSFQK